MTGLINQISVGFAILAFLGFVIYRYRNDKKIVLNDAVTVIIAGGMLPVAIAFVIYPFFPSLIDSIETMSLQITLTGLILLFVYSKTIIEIMKSDSS